MEHIPNASISFDPPPLLSDFKSFRILHHAERCRIALRLPFCRVHNEIKRNGWNFDRASRIYERKGKRKGGSFSWQKWDDLGFRMAQEITVVSANKRIRDTLYPPLPRDRLTRCDRRESSNEIPNVYLCVQRLSTFIDRYNRETQRDAVFQRALLHIPPYYV